MQLFSFALVQKALEGALGVGVPSKIPRNLQDPKKSNRRRTLFSHRIASNALQSEGVKRQETNLSIASHCSLFSLVHFAITFPSLSLVSLFSLSRESDGKVKKVKK